MDHLIEAADKLRPAFLLTPAFKARMKEANYLCVYNPPPAKENILPQWFHGSPLMTAKKIFMCRFYQKCCIVSPAD